MDHSEDCDSTDEMADETPSVDTLFNAKKQTIVHGDVYNISGNLIINSDRNTTTNGLIQSIVTDLKQYYLNHLCKKPIYPWCPDTYVDLENIYIPLTIDIELPGPRSIKQRVEFYQDLFKSTESSTRFVLCGSPRQGKSSFCAKLAYDWCTGAALKDIDLLFILQLGSMDHRSNIEDAICSQLLSIAIDSATIANIIAKSGSSILLVLDGLDEAPPNMMIKNNIGNHGNLVKTMKHEHLRDCRVLVTTRPWRMREITQTPAYRRLELQKMQKSDVKKFVVKFFGQNKDDVMTVKLGNDLLRYIEENRLLIDITTPLMVLLVCWYWSETMGRSAMPERIGKLYKEIMGIMYRNGCGTNYGFQNAEHGKQERFINGITTVFLPSKKRTISQARIVKELGKVGHKGLTPNITKIVYTRNEIKRLCKTPTVQQQAQRMGILCKRDRTSLQFFHKSAQEYCAGVYLANCPDKLSSYLQQIKSVKDALSVAQVLQFASTTTSNAKMILQKLISVFQSEISFPQYYDESLTFNDTRPIQQFIELCLECNFEADAQAEVNVLIRSLFLNGSVLFYGISPKAATSLAYFMTHCVPEDIRRITLRSIAHTSHPFINLGPTNKMYNATLHGIKSLSADKIREINDRFKAAHPNLHDDWQKFDPMQLAAYVPCVQACEDPPPSSETNILPIVQSFRHTRLETLDLSNFQLGRNYDHLLESLESDGMKYLLLLNMRSTAPSGSQMTRLAAHIGQMPQLESIDVSWNKAEAGRTFPMLARSLNKCTNLKILYVNNMGAPADDLLRVAQNLPSQLSLLSIHGNQMNDSVAACLAKTLPMALRTLFVSLQHVSEDTHPQFLKAINRKIPRIQELRIWDSPYSSDLVQQGGYILATCLHLDRLVLQSTSDETIPSDNLQVYVEGLEKAPKVRSLSLYGIRLSQEGFGRLVNVCRQKSIQKLQLHRNLLPDATDPVTLEDFIILG